MEMIKLNLRNFNFWTVISLLTLIAGLSFWIFWGTRYNDWTDIGIYSITIVLVLPGIVGLIISLMDKSEEKD